MYPLIEPLESRQCMSASISGLLGVDQALTFLGLSRDSFHTTGVNWTSPTRSLIGRYSGQVDLKIQLRRAVHYNIPVSLMITGVSKDGTIKGKVSSPLLGSYSFSQKTLIPESGEPFTVTVDDDDLTGSLTAEFTRGIGLRGSFEGQYRGRHAEGTFYLNRG